MSFLEQIRPEIEQRVQQAKSERPPEELRERVVPANGRFRNAIENRKTVSLIAEFKRSSPSAGDLRKQADPEPFLSLYDQRAEAVSVLTEPQKFDGDPELLARSTRITNRPLLRKDFIINSYQILRARTLGADAVLLIEGLLSEGELNELLNVTENLGMDALVECHSESGLERVLNAGASIIGINNRNLDTLEVDPERVSRLVKQIPENERNRRTIVAESGLTSRSDLTSLPESVDAALVGSALMQASSPLLKLCELTGKPGIKFCGVTSPEEARSAYDAGADVIGLNFYEPSPRYITPEEAKAIASETGPGERTAGVFVNQNPNEVKRIARTADLDILQFSGDEPPGSLTSYREMDQTVMKSVQLASESSLSRLREYEVDYYMVDAFDEDQHGGTGTFLNTELLESSEVKEEPLIIAGGLTPENVGSVLNQFDPVMVDVCSGIESRPGEKDPALMEAFSRQVNSPLPKNLPDDPDEGQT